MEWVVRFASGLSVLFEAVKAGNVCGSERPEAQIVSCYEAGGCISNPPFPMCSMHALASHILIMSACGSAGELCLVFSVTPPLYCTHVRRFMQVRLPFLVSYRSVTRLHMLARLLHKIVHGSCMSTVSQGDGGSTPDKGQCEDRSGDLIGFGDVPHWDLTSQPPYSKLHAHLNRLGVSTLELLWWIR